MSEHIYEVTVANIGYIHYGHSYKKALKEFWEYVDISFNRKGSRSFEENVTLWKDNEPVKEFDISPDNRIYVRANAVDFPENYYGVRTPITYRCQLSGCNGIRQQVLWPKRNYTYVCTRGLVSDKEGRVRVG